MVTCVLLTFITHPHSLPILVGIFSIIIIVSITFCCIMCSVFVPNFCNYVIIICITINDQTH